jgi:heterodisulfide reductase subunit C
MQMINFEFRNDLIKKDFSLNYCYQCGTCSSTCPVALITNGEYNPRKIIEQSLLGLKDLLLKDQKPNVWLCCTCQMCVEECPQNVFLTEIFERIKNKIIFQLGLPKVESAKISEIKKLLDATEFEKKINSLEGSK